MNVVTMLAPELLLPRYSGTVSTGPMHWNRQSQTVSFETKIKTKSRISERRIWHEVIWGKEDSRLKTAFSNDGFPGKTEIEDLNSPWGLLSEICQIGVYPAEAQRPGYRGGPRVMDTLSIGRPSRPTHRKADFRRTRIDRKSVV